VIGAFYGRTAELTTLDGWLVADSCRLVMVLGMGGVGKTALVARLVTMVAPQFEHVIWCSLLSEPPLSDTFRMCFRLWRRRH
jgi:ABC-type branched-subunit amino acid transport system ATPase component